MFNSRIISLFVIFLWLVAVNNTFAQYPNIRVNLASSTDPEEVTIAINPTNPQNLVAGANISYFYYSNDGGMNWNQGNLSSSLGVWGDPSVCFDVYGTAYFGHLSNPTSGSWLDRIVVQKSVDGGISWDNGVGIGLNPPKDQDKEWIVADHTGSPYRNNLYMSWTEFDSYGSTNPLDSSRILFARKVDSLPMWSPSVRVSDVGGDCIDSDSTVEGAVPAVGPEGQVYISWSSSQGILFDKSLDGGATFGDDIFVVDQPGGWDFNVAGIYRTNGFPITLCDISSSPYNGTIYIVWSDQRNGTDNTDVFLIKSTDGGASWGNMVRVNDDTTSRHQFFPWAALDPVTGNIYVVFYDRRSTTGNATNVYVARSTDGGDTFENFRVNEMTFTPSNYIFFGDYINIAARDGKVYPIWMRLDNTVLSVWIAIIDDTPFAIEEEEINNITKYRLYQNYPNPFNSQTKIGFYLPSSEITTIRVYDVLGKEVRTIMSRKMPEGYHAITFDSGSLPSGIYYYRISAGLYTAVQKMILIR